MVEKSKTVVLPITGGIGRNIFATAMIRNFKKVYPDKKIIETPKEVIVEDIETIDKPIVEDLQEEDVEPIVEARKKYQEIFGLALQ